MMVVCNKCGKEYDDSELKCPNCGESSTEEKEIDETLDVEVSTPLNDVKISETPVVVNEVIETKVEPISETIEEELKTVEQPITLNEVTPTIESLPTIEVPTEKESQIQAEVQQPIVETEVNIQNNVVENNTVELNEVVAEITTLPEVEITEAVVKADMPIIETPKLDDILPTDTLSNIDDTNISNENLETISVEVKEEVLEEKEEVFEVPEMPAPVVGEVDLEQLINKYDTEEKINLEKMESKKKYEEAINEQKRLEEEAKRQQPMPKPDLLATIPDEEALDDLVVDKNIKKGKKPMRKLMNVILVILVLAIIGILIWYFVQGMSNKENNNYIKPVDNYFNAYKEGNSSKMLESFVPCVAQTEEITSLITTTINNSAQYGTITIEYKEKNTEVVNKDDQQHLDTYLKTMCPTNTPTIEEYKHVYIEQKIKGQEEKEFTINNPEFWVVKISNNWYILQLQ